MLKKFFLPCLAAAIALPLPLSIHAANATPVIFPLSLAASSKTLSANDRDSVKKEISDLIVAMNNRDKKKYLSHYSNKYHAEFGKGVVIDRNTLVQNADSSIGFLKSLGIKIKPQEIRVVGIGKNQATAEIIYSIGLSEKSPFANDQKTINELKETPQGFFLTLEKTNGRWLIISGENLIVKGAEKLAANNDKKTGDSTVSINPLDQQFFTDFFKRHLDALNRKNLNDYLATLDASSPQYKKSKEETVQLFKEYTLKFTAQSVKLVSRGKNEAVVEMVATVKKVSGGGFKDSKMKTTNFLRKSDGKWRIVDTSIDSVTELVAKK
jgi:ketosteroid isomerase-like protein